MTAYLYDVVLTARTAADALAKMPLARPEVVLLDLNLPDESGMTLALKLRKLIRRLKSWSIVESAPI